jgi:apolipoprotein D and lipocalin family protein
MKQLFLISFLTFLVYSQKCAVPAPAVDYTLNAYIGKWYEMGKYQTAGGGFFERDCECTESDIGVSQGKIYAYQSCIKNGKKTGINATLLPTDINGHYIEQFQFNKGAYYVIYLDNDYAIEYDCNESVGITNYCVHIMAKTTDIDDAKLEELKKYALRLGLNPKNLPFQKTEQHKCRNQLSFD